MVEVPALLWQLDEICARADFLSVGTNDLIQYMFAADRENKHVSSRFDSLSAPLLRALRAIVEAAARNKTPVTLCGEMGGQPLEALGADGDRLPQIVDVAVLDRSGEGGVARDRSCRGEQIGRRPHRCQRRRATRSASRSHDIRRLHGTIPRLAATPGCGIDGARRDKLLESHAAARQARSHPAPPRRNFGPARRRVRIRRPSSRLSRELAELDDVVAAIRAYRGEVGGDRRHRIRSSTIRSSTPRCAALPRAERAEARGAARGARTEAARRACCRRMPPTRKAPSSKSAPAPAATRRRSLPAISSACISVMPETQGWRVEIVSASEGALGGFKEIIAEIEGRGVFARLKFESGVHRVQRVPETETQGRIHTSAATVAVLPEAQDVDIDINETDLKIDTDARAGRRRPARQQDGIRRSASRICRRIRSSSCRTSARSTRTARGRWRSCARGFTIRSARSSMPNARRTGARRSARAIAPSASAPIISRKAASPITASI